MSADPASWLARCLDARPELQALERALHALGAEARASVIAALARLASRHEAHALLALERAPQLWAAGGAERFGRWLALGERLLFEAPISRAGATRYFGLELGALGPGGLDTAEAWCALGRRLSAQAPHLGRMFFERTATLLTRPHAMERLVVWVSAAEPYLAQDDWRVSLVLEAYFDAAESTCALHHPAAWIDLACALAQIHDPRRVLARAAGALHMLTPVEQAPLLAAFTRWAGDNAEAAAMLLERLPPLLAAAIREEEIAARVQEARTSDAPRSSSPNAEHAARHSADETRAVGLAARTKVAAQSSTDRARVPGAAGSGSSVTRARSVEDGPLDAAQMPRAAQVRSEDAARSLPRREAVAALCRVLSCLPAAAVRGIAALLPGMSTVLALPALELRGFLTQIESLAQAQPDAALAALRALPELYKRADPAHTARWFAFGARLASENPAAAQAFFALESRTSLRVLTVGSGVAELDQSLGTWRKLIQMLSDCQVVVRRTEQPSLRPPLEAAAPREAVALPDYVDWFDTQAENLMVYRFLALQLAGRLEHGTYSWRGAQGEHVQQALASERTGLHTALFLVADGVRIAAWTARAYPGSARETASLARKLLALWEHDAEADLGSVCDVLLALSLTDLSRFSGAAAVGGGSGAAWAGLGSGGSAVGAAGGGDGSAAASGGSGAAADGCESVVGSGEALVPACVPARVASLASTLLSRLHRADASVDDALAVSEQLARLFDSGTLQLRAAGLEELDAALRSAASEDVGGSQSASGSASDSDSTEPSTAAPVGGTAAQSQSHGQGVVLDAAAANVVADAQLTAAGQDAPLSAAGRPRPGVLLAQSYVYDEWDHTLHDYRSRHCHVHELALDSDGGAFFAQTLRDNRELLSQVRRQFEHMRPERYRTVRGLEDGEDFDLNALTAARVESRAGRNPSTRIYTARTRQARDVATLFLLDMSASTEQPYERGDDTPPRRIIDTLKEALVVMCTALDTLGDAYAIYGFSSQGRKRVEVYEVKAFDQPLTAAARARLGSIGPRHGTRMGAALRHALSKLASVQAHARHLILLSDGFPQDQEYGDDRRSHTYGMKDTAVALRELTRAGTLPFCITVDRAGHDYLRLMCDPDQYMVIDHIDQLPRELPKIYRRIVR